MYQNSNCIELNRSGNRNQAKPERTQSFFRFIYICNICICVYFIVSVSKKGLDITGYFKL